MKLHPRVTPAAVDLVKRFEGFRPRAAKTPEGRFTIGYGHLLSPRDSADEAAISEAEAEFLLKHDLSVTAEAVEDALLAPVNDNQFAALLSFAFNIGVDNFKGSSALRRLNEGAYLQAAAALELWRRADFGGEVLVVDQLVRRRAIEKALFLAPPEGFMPLPSSVLRPAFDHSVVGAAVAWAAARERTAVSRIALEGPETAPGLSVPPGREGEPAPSAAIAAADALAVRLSRILPEDEVHDDGGSEIGAPAALERLPAPSTEGVASPAPGPLVLEAEEPEPGFEPARPAVSHPPAALDFTGQPTALEPDAPLRFSAQAESTTGAGAFSYADQPKRADSGFDLPPAPVLRDAEPQAEPVALVHPPQNGAGAQAHYDEAEHAAGPPPLVAEVAGAASAFASTSWRRRFARAPEPTAFEASSPFEAAPSLFDPPIVGRAEPASDFFQVEGGADTRFHVTPLDAPTVPLFERPAFFQVLGLVGVALFVGSIICMLNKASFGCLLMGVVGVLAMAPAAAFFLFRFLGRPVDPTSAEHDDLATMMQATPPVAEPEAVEAEGAERNDSPFDAAWR